MSQTSNIASRILTLLTMSYRAAWVAWVAASTSVLAGVWAEHLRVERDFAPVLLRSVLRVLSYPSLAAESVFDRARYTAHWDGHVYSNLTMILQDSFVVFFILVLAFQNVGLLARRGWSKRSPSRTDNRINAT